MSAADGSNGGSAKSGRRLAGLRVLLAEDIWIIAEAQKQVLQLHGATVTGPAATVADARALAQAGAFDCAVFDVNLRNELATPVIETLAQRGVQIVILSGSDLDPHLRSLAAACLEKPFNGQQLVSAIAACCGR